MAESGTSSSNEDVWIYHEKQVSSLCGQHCINNLVQGDYYTVADLAEIAQELDEKERQHMLSEGLSTPDALKFLAEDSGNVDEAGNFSLQVLNEALSRLHGINLVSADSEVVGGTLRTAGPFQEFGFVLNRHSHWIAFRSVGGTYWDLNSMLDYPARLTSFALEATLEQHRNDGYSVFVVRGKDLPPEATKEPGRGPRDRWYRVKELLEVARAKGGSSSSGPRTAASDVWLNSGPGQRLDSRGGGPDATSSQNSHLEGVSEEEQLAMAISASMAQEDGDGQKTCTPTERVSSAPGTADDDEEVEDEMSQAIALSLSPGGADGRPSPTPSIAEVYRPKPVQEEEPTGADVVRIQLRLDGNKRVVRKFRRTDPVSALVDFAAYALAESDGRPLTSAFDLIDPEGRPLLTAGRIVVHRSSGDGSCTIGSERLGGASVLARRTR